MRVKSHTQRSINTPRNPQIENLAVEFLFQDSINSGSNRGHYANAQIIRLLVDESFIDRLSELDLKSKAYPRLWS